MKKFTPLTLVITGALLAIATTSIYSSSSGAPQGHSGSEASNNRTCATAGCHAGGPAITTQNATLDTDIPATGFETNTTYSFTINANSNGATHPVIGFSASVEDGNGNFLGSLNSPNNTTNTNFANTFVTHTFNSRVATAAGQSWTFEWNSGTTTDTAIVYVAVNFANGDGGRNGDATYTETFQLLPADASISTGNDLNAAISWSPNPVKNFLNIRLENIQARKAEVTLTDMTGKSVLNENHLIEGSRKTIQLETGHLSPGMYILVVNAGKKSFHERVIVN
jgi:hypothetical protein